MDESAAFPDGFRISDGYCVGVIGFMVRFRYHGFDSLPIVHVVGSFKGNGVLAQITPS